MLAGTLKQNPNSRIRKVWIRKNDLSYYVFNIAYKSIVPNSWYFNCGFSRHMIGNRFMLTNFKSHAGGLITFADGAQIVLG